ncbi:MAG TPA: 16S rRNA (guanine(527)-N(7))-methyltransferase RsmG [Gemmatimonadaceae bacterium]|nr:16S rRNA (guanine(527)-N(7))-methyltransferase RsmG [Gemmatimonadaceae bacterium]
MTSIEFRDQLARRTRLAKAPIALGMLDPLEAYFRLLTQWNAKMNLTALPLDIPTDETFDRLLVEPLAASKQIPTHARGVWFDLGSGGGSPAIPLKIARPALRLTMIESKERKSAFLREAIRTLPLTDTTVTTQRFEDVASRAECAGQGDIVTVRAVKADSALFETAGRLLRTDGRLLWFRPAHAESPDPLGFERLLTVQLIESPQSFLNVYRRMFHVEQN